MIFILELRVDSGREKGRKRGRGRETFVSKTLGINKPCIPMKEKFP
jgi:hypothetical protein